MRLITRIGGLAIARPLIGSMLSRDVAAPVLVRAASVAVPTVFNLAQHGSGTY